MIQFIVFVLIGYLIGSICSAVIVCQLCGLPDPRSVGSKNPGATNVLRIAGKQYAVIVIIADLLKGTIPVLLAHYFDASTITLGFTALAAVVGHMYPVFFEFNGGKGVATAIGGLLGLQFMLGVLVGAAWLLIANFTGYSSLASIVSMCLAPLFAIVLIGKIEIFPPLFVITILVLYKHRDNITRLLDGVEPKIKFKKSILDEIIEPAADSDVSANEPMAEEVIAKPAKKPTKPKQSKPKGKKTSK